MFGDRRVVPKSLRRKMMLELTTTHPEVARMKSPVGGCAYWSNIDARNKEYVTKCSARKKPRKTKM